MPIPGIVKVRAGGRGSGCAVGTRGVLTAWHVVAPFARHEAEHCLAVLDPALGSRTFRCTIAWKDEASDIAVLSVIDEDAGAWLDALPEDARVALVECGNAAMEAEAVGYPDSTVTNEQPQPDPVLGWLLPGGGPVNGLVPFDLITRPPKNSALWRGMSGAGLRERSTGRLVGIVTKVDEDRQSGRFYVAPIPDPGTVSQFGAALVAVGATPVLEGLRAPLARRLLHMDTLDPSGRARSLNEVSDLSIFGVRYARTDVANQGNAYFPYVRRQFDVLLDRRLAEHALGADRRLLLLVGEPMSGKSRAGIEGLLRSPDLAQRTLLLPLERTDLDEVTSLMSRDGSVVWLDDIDDFFSSLTTTLIRRWRDSYRSVVVGTIRQDALSGLQDRARSTWDFITDESIVETLTVPSDWETNETEVIDWDEGVQEALASGVPLGEFLGAAEELRKRLAAGSAVQRAFINALADWARTGIVLPCKIEVATRLWLQYLPERISVDLHGSEDDLNEALSEVSKWAKCRIQGTSTRMVRGRNGALAIEDYLVAARTKAGDIVPRFVWEAAQQVAGQLIDESPRLLLRVSWLAYQSGLTDLAESAFKDLVTKGGSSAAFAWYGLGSIAEESDNEAARLAYVRALETEDPDARSLAAVSLGRLLTELQDKVGAEKAFRVALEEQHPPAIRSFAATLLGQLLKSNDDLSGARDAFAIALELADDAGKSDDLIRLGMAEHALGNDSAATSRFREVANASDPHARAQALNCLGGVSAEAGDTATAIDYFRLVVESGDPEYGPGAMVNLGRLVAEKGEENEACDLFEGAIAMGTPEVVAYAALRLAPLCQKQGDLVRLYVAYEDAIENGALEIEPLMVVRLGAVMAGMGHLPEAHDLFDAAIAVSELSGKTDVSALAMLLRSVTLSDDDYISKLNEDAKGGDFWVPFYVDQRFSGDS